MCVCPPPSGRETTDNRSFCFAPRGVRSLTAALSPRGSKQNGGYPSFPGAGGRAHTRAGVLPAFRAGVPAGVAGILPASGRGLPAAGLAAVLSFEALLGRPGGGSGPPCGGSSPPPAPPPPPPPT